MFLAPLAPREGCTAPLRLHSSSGFFALCGLHTTSVLLVGCTAPLWLHSSPVFSWWDNVGFADGFAPVDAH